VLLNALEQRMPGAVHLGARCTGFEQDGATATLLTQDGRRITGDVLVGADGVHSRIRNGLFGDAQAAFTGFVCWRAVIPMHKLPERLRRPYGSNWMAPHGHVVTYPLRRGELLNLVTAIERDGWLGESWSEPGDMAEFRADLAIWHADVQCILDQVDVPYKWALLGREPLPSWSRGHVTLLGDACHPTLPFLAQGANMAIEDGAVLARCLESYADIEDALRHYDAARCERTARIVRGAADNVYRFHNPILADPVAAPDFISREFASDRVSQRYDWLFEYNALTVPV
jgi:salicylate hydroxylase